MRLQDSIVKDILAQIILNATIIIAPKMVYVTGPRKREIKLAKNQNSKQIQRIY